jgi:6-phosphogluconolactonase
MTTSDNHTCDSKPARSGITRRQFLPLLGATALAAVIPRTFADEDDSDEKPSRATARFVYVGTYTAPGVPPGGTQPSSAVGIYVFRMHRSDGDLTLVQIVPASTPSFLALDPSKTNLYSVNEDTAGHVSAYAIDQTNGKLSFLNTASADGMHTTHLSVHPSGKYLLAANYSSGNFPVFAIQSNGLIGAKTADFQGVGNGTGPNPARQEGPHAHQILTDLDGNHVLGVDLGADKVNVLNLDLGTGALSPNTVPFAPVASGSGPRHMAFHPNRRRAYVLDELVSSITVFNYDPVRGAFIWLQTISTLPKSFTGSNTTAEIRIHPSGQFLYNTNRGHNSITMFEIDQHTGRLRVIGWQSTLGEWPRGMNIDASGTFLYAANQNTDTIVVFRINRSKGTLKPTGAVVHTPTPVDVEFGRPV